MESSFEDYLRGTPGVEKVQVDSQGQVLGLLSYRAPGPGRQPRPFHLADRPARPRCRPLDDWVLKARGMTGHR